MAREYERPSAFSNKLSPKATYCRYLSASGATCRPMLALWGTRANRGAITKQVANEVAKPSPPATDETGHRSLPPCFLTLRLATCDWGAVLKGRGQRAGAHAKPPLPFASAFASAFCLLTSPSDF